MKVAVVYWTGTGNTEAMAKAVVKGIVDSGNEVNEFTASEFSVDKVSEYDAFAFGCPAMGAEVLEESEFDPMFSSVKEALSGKKVALFGSYGWGDGEWMRTWVEDCKASGIDLVNDGVIANEAPDDEKIKELEELGKSLVA